MKTLKWIAIVVGLLLFVFLAGAALMDPTYRVERVATVAAPAEKVYLLVSDPRAWTTWTVWNRRDPNMKLRFSGATTGAGAKWAWEGKEGNGRMEFTAADPGKSVTYALAFPDMGMSSKGMLTLTPTGSATRVSWSNEGDVGANPLMRWFVPFLDRMMGPDFEAGLANLKALAEKP